MQKEKILVIEDEFQMRFLLRTHLSIHFEIDEAENGEEGLVRLTEFPYKLVLLDIMMEGKDGFEICREIRETNNSIPIIMLTARSDIKERVHGLNVGADDYVVKPFDPEELIARINALLRRTDVNQNTGSNEEENVTVFNELKIDSESREVFVGNEKVEFTLKEFDLLLLFTSNHKRVFTRDILLNKIWDETKILDDRTVDSHVRHIRHKLKQAGLSFNPIKTVWGVGYKFNLPDGNQ